MTGSPSDGGCDCHKPLAPPVFQRPGGCCGDDPYPGVDVVRVFVAGANIARNRLPGNPVRLPAIVVEVGGRRVSADQVERDGSSTVQQSSDPQAKPSVWVELRGQVRASYRGELVLEVTTTNGDANG